MFAEMVKRKQLKKQNQKYCLIFESSAVFYSTIQSTHLEKHIFNRLQQGKDTTFIFIYKKMSIKLVNGVFKWPISLFETMKIILRGLKIKS